MLDIGLEDGRLLDRSLFSEPPPLKPSTQRFWDRIELLSDDTLLQTNHQTE